MLESLKIKENLYLQCVAFVENRFQTIQDTITEIQESLTSETKSSAGDKHETGRAMLQLEREKAGNQLAEIQKIREHLSKIVLSTNSSGFVGLGNIVFTNKTNYFIGISAGKLEVDEVEFYAISPNTPVGQLLMRKTIGECVSFNKQSFIIENIV